jgi:predicted transcriptional regulator
VSELDTSFTFRLTSDDKAALADLADRLGCDRGAALRRVIRQAKPGLLTGRNGQFETRQHRFPIRLRVMESVE